MTHVCHAIYCDVPVPPERLFCKKHWFMLPKDLRDAVWQHYRPGQCDDKRPSREWLDIADAAIKFVYDREVHGI